MTRSYSNGVRFVAIAGLALVTNCGPGPLPAENPPQNVEPAPEPVPVQVESTVVAETAPTVAPEPPPPVEPPIVVPASAGLQTPESILFDPATDKYFVSNINGGPNETDNNGFIALVNPDGTVHQLDFIAGGKKGVLLNAPKGMALHNGTLYVADITTVRKFDAKTGAAQGAITIPKSSFINDVVIDAEGTLYVTDTGVKIGKEGVSPTGTDAVYKITKGKVTALAKGEHLGKPNGIALRDGAVLVVTFGNKQLLQLDAQGAVTSTTELPAGSLDGLVLLPDGHLVVSSWDSQSVYLGSMTGSWTAIGEGLASPADIGFDPGRSRVLVPLFTQNELRFVPVRLASSVPSPSKADPEGTVPTASTTASNAAPHTSGGAPSASAASPVSGAAPSSAGK